MPVNIRRMADMIVLGTKVREAPYADDAWEVARETMRRARQNVELIIRRLDDIGYQFGMERKDQENRTEIGRFWREDY